MSAPLATPTLKATLKFQDPEDIKTLADKLLKVVSLKGDSSLNKGYNFKIDLLSVTELKLAELQDQKVSIEVRHGKEKQNIHGRILKVTEIKALDTGLQKSKQKKRFAYEFTIVSALNYLQQNQQTQIFHKQTAAEIIVQVLSRYTAILDFSVKSSELDAQALSVRPYTTQYKQSDLDFILMLCEQDGLILKTDFSQEKEVISLCDLEMHQEYFTHKAELLSLQKEISFHASFHEHYHYNYANKSPESQTSRGELRADVEENDFTQKLRAFSVQQKQEEVLNTNTNKDLSRRVKIASERALAQTHRIYATSKSLHLKDGVIYTHENESWLILQTQYEALFIKRDSTGDENFHFTSTITACDANIVYRDPYTHKQSKVYGVLRAKVTSHKEEPVLNKDGEVRVVFNFNQQKPSSAYLRYSNAQSGDGFGVNFVPRVGSDVLVSFINANPDAPLISSVYHSKDNEVPYNYQTDKTKSYIKTSSFPQYEEDEGYHEILFEDAKDKEELNIRSQKDFTLEVTNNADISIHANSSSLIQGNQEINIQGNQNIQIAKQRKVFVSSDVLQNVKETHVVSSFDYEQSIKKDHMSIIQGDYKYLAHTELIRTIKNNLLSYVEGDAQEEYLDSLYINIAKDMRLQVGDNFSLKADTITLEAENIAFDATGELSFSAGGSVFSVGSAGLGIMGLSDNLAAESGEASTALEHPEIVKSPYSKLRVTLLEVDIEEQSELEEVLTFTATIEMLEDLGDGETPEWVEAEGLEAYDFAKLTWTFVKTNTDDIALSTREVFKDDIRFEDNKMIVMTEALNIKRYAHVSCVVGDIVEDEASIPYVCVELKRDVNIVSLETPQSIKGIKEVSTKIELNIINPSDAEIETLSVSLDEVYDDDSEENFPITIDDSLIIEHTITVDKVLVDLHFNAEVV
ncbi:type VI secretion system tip protein VgrG [Sulfurimonas sp. MAG313]|nr:type VI secretion system tip protein TssI/VgrG [Sulfurimonas sp. MAG313]MDF1880599.1 type VI secretion system tip protein VgrG [Sulfurimonas sp. MAG313]